MSEILSLKNSRFVDATKFKTLADKLAIKDIEARIYFFRELHGIVRKLPIKIFDDDQDRIRLMTAIQDALDQAIDEEEEELE